MRLGQLGFTTIELLVAAGLTGAVALFTTQLVRDAAENEAFIKARAEISSAHSIISTNFRNKDYCKAILAGRAVPAAGSSINLANLQFTHPTNGNVITLLTSNQDYGAFKILTSNYPTTRGIRLVGSSTSNGMVDVEITYTMKLRNSYQIVEKIPILVQSTASVITSCGAFLAEANKASEKEFCATLTTDLASWDSTAESGAGKCILRQVSCPYGSVVERFTSLGVTGVFCVPIQDRLQLSELFNLSGVGQNCSSSTQFRLGFSGGKVTIICIP